MHWYRDLTRRQRSVLIGLTFAVVAVIGTLSWTVWRTIQAAETPSPVSTPDSGPSALSTPTPPPSPSPTPQPSATPTVPFDVSQAGLIAMDIAGTRNSRTGWRTPVAMGDDHQLSGAL